MTDQRRALHGQLDDLIALVRSMSDDTADPATEPPSQAPTMPPAGPNAERLRNARTQGEEN